MKHLEHEPRVTRSGGPAPSSHHRRTTHRKRYRERQIKRSEKFGADHLAHPAGVKMFSYRRVKNDQRDAADLADLLRMGRLPEAWIAPPATRELCGWVRHRAKLVGLRSNLKCQVHAVLAGAGVAVPMSDLFGPSGQRLLGSARLSLESRSRVDSLLGLITALDVEIDTFATLVAGRLRADPGYRAIQAFPGVGPTLAAVFVAEVGEISRFARPGQLASWAGLTPIHHESDTRVRRGRITKQGSRLVRWAAVEAVQRVPGHTRLGQRRDRVAERRGRSIGVVAAARDLVTLVFYGLRDHHLRCLAAPAA
ncbi:IS110 family transposase [Pseudonocardia kujensis]|uniref:IS110 family transposase n=1 Tax=Pseudonocardia kujensis TaxID=1128675 RepID=UPI0027E02D49|nr:IS110 family transposase [Pseudonocardia kujensis]